MRKLFFSVMIIGVMAACSGSPQNLEQKIDALVEQNNYEEAIDILQGEEQSQETTALKEEVHLQYGIHLIYNAAPADMRQSANNALRQFISVLEINPQNEKARAEIEQILAIYRTFPDRQPEQEVLDELEKMGFQV